MLLKLSGKRQYEYYQKFLILYVFCMIKKKKNKKIKFIVFFSMKFNILGKGVKVFKKTLNRKKRL